MYIRYDDDLPVRPQTYMDVFDSIINWDDMTVYQDIRRMLTPPVAPAKRFSITDKGGKRRRKTRRRRRRQRKTTKNPRKNRKQNHRKRRTLRRKTKRKEYSYIV